MTIQNMSCNSIAVGRFNTGILANSAWLAEQKVISTPLVNIQVDPSGSRPVALHVDGVIWESTQNMLKVTPDAESSDIDPSKFIARALKQLVHTPVAGIGNNFSYTFSPVISNEMLQFNAPGELENAHEKTIGYTLNRIGAVVTVALHVHSEEASEDKIAAIEFNYHRDVKDVQEAIKATEMFRKDLSDSKEILESLGVV